MQTMTNEPPRPAPTFVQFPPIPLLSGDTVADTDGNPHTIEQATITLVGDDGTRFEVDLEYRFGGWWAPAAGPNA